MQWLTWRTWVLAMLVTVFAAWPAAAEARRPQAASIGTVQEAELPPQAVACLRLIRAGGPFASSKDGSVFANRERSLPAQRRGYYREYTVRTPGAHDRGARRIVCGGTEADHPEACYYTNDHYRTFRRIVD